MNPTRLAASTVLALALSVPALVLSAPALGADGPVPIRGIAPDTTYVEVAADDFARTVERWRTTGLHSFLKSPQMAKILGDDGGAQDAMDERLGELGVPAGSFSWPKAFGAVLFTVHDEELDAEEIRAGGGQVMAAHREGSMPLVILTSDDASAATGPLAPRSGLFVMRHPHP